MCLLNLFWIILFSGIIIAGILFRTSEKNPSILFYLVSGWVIVFMLASMMGSIFPSSAWSKNIIGSTLSFAFGSMVLATIPLLIGYGLGAIVSNFLKKINGENKK